MLGPRYPASEHSQLPVVIQESWSNHPTLSLVDLCPSLLFRTMATFPQDYCSYLLTGSSSMGICTDLYTQVPTPYTPQIFKAL